MADIQADTREREEMSAETYQETEQDKNPGISQDLQEPLKRCPFCGQRSTLKYYEDVLISIQCTQCHTAGPLGNTKKEARILWNDRTRDRHAAKCQDEMLGQIEAARAAGYREGFQAGKLKRVKDIISWLNKHYDLDCWRDSRAARLDR